MKYIILIGLILISGCITMECDKQDEITRIDNLTQDLINCLGKDKGNLTCPQCPTNATQCPVCPDCSAAEGYLTFEEYQKMSIRIKWLERRLDYFNSTNYTKELEHNLTICSNSLKLCNSTLSAILNITNPN